MDYGDAKKRLLAAQALLLEPSSSLDKFGSVKTLIKGIRPELDEFLDRCDKDLSTVQKILGRDVLSLSTENLPENTEEQKKRKKAVLFFWKTWNSLKGEVERVQAEMNSANSAQDGVVKSSHWGRIFNFAKGPFGIVTIAAVAIVTTTSATSVQITIHNQGCATMVPSSSMPFPLPGISFPKDPIPSGGSGAASIPGLPITIDGSKSGKLSISSLKLNMDFELGDISDMTFDDVHLLGKTTHINLSEKKQHDLVFICS